LANLLFARELHRQLSACGSQILSVAAHPGVVRTGLFGHVAGASGLWLDIGSRIVGHPVDHGILPTLFRRHPGRPRRNIHRPQGLSAATRIPGHRQVVEERHQRRIRKTAVGRIRIADWRATRLRDTSTGAVNHARAAIQYVPEDSPDEIGTAIAEFVRKNLSLPDTDRSL
jgi:hypothetical protein